MEKRRSQEVLADEELELESNKKTKLEENNTEQSKEPKDPDDSEIGSDLDSELDDEDIEEALGGNSNASTTGSSSSKNQIVGLFDKVQRTRNRWRCNFSSCIARIDGRDYLFHKLNGEFEW